MHPICILFFRHFKRFHKMCLSPEWKRSAASLPVLRFIGVPSLYPSFPLSPIFSVCLTHLSSSVSIVLFLSPVFLYLRLSISLSLRLPLSFVRWNRGGKRILIDKKEERERKGESEREREKWQRKKRREKWAKFKREAEIGIKSKVWGVAGAHTLARFTTHLNGQEARRGEDCGSRDRRNDRREMKMKKKRPEKKQRGREERDTEGWHTGCKFGIPLQS